METKQQQRFKKKDNKVLPIYSRSLLTRNVVLPIGAIGKNIKETLEKNISANFEGKCVVEGYIKPSSSTIVTYSSGLVSGGSNILFDVVFECMVCFPVENALVMCVAKNITKAGIRAESAEETPSPVVVFIAKDHHYNNSQFAEIKEGGTFKARVVGQRFELNDKYVSIIGELVKEKYEKQRITIQEE